MEAPVVLLYNFDPERGRRIKLLCLPLKIRPREVSPSQYNLPLETLLRGGEAPEGEEVPAFTDEMLVMANLTGTQMNRFLQAFRRNKLSPVALKAVLTAANAAWDSVRLHRELKLEHEAMLRGESAHET